MKHSVRTVLHLLVLTLSVDAAAQDCILPSASPSYEIDSRLVIIGDAGGADASGSTPALDLLRVVLTDTSTAAHVVFTGDNIYCCGLPDSTSPERGRAEHRLKAQLRAVDAARGEVIFVPGNHDWGKAPHYDPVILNRQERYIESWGDGRFRMLPNDGLAGPHETKLSDHVRLVAIDTQWWLMDKPKPTGESDDYEVREDGELLAALSDLLNKRDDELVIVVGHHPLMSMGRHGGHYPLRDHVFPLTELWEHAWIPLPVVGSLYPLLRNAIGAEQDVSNRKFQAFARSMLSMMQTEEGRSLYVAGHEHGLQHIPIGPLDHILVSGGGSRPSWVSSGQPAAFTYGGFGLLVLDVLQSGATILYALSPADNNIGYDVLYRTELLPEKRVILDEAPSAEAPSLPDSASAVLDENLEAGSVRSFFWGDHHRRAWTRKVKAPVFDIGTVQGGLQPVKKGGGVQTTSVRLVDSLGHEYVLRTMTKDATATIPEPFRKTIAREVFADQNSAIFPYGALLVPPLSRAASIYHPSASLYYVPRDPRFGPFEDLVADRLMLFERRPDDDMTGLPQFGESLDVESAAKFYRELREDNDNRVDARMYARVRLLDMYMSDWDRHKDQWRWASFDNPDGKGRFFQPIPRDRDWAFNYMNGVLPSIIKSPWVLPKFQDFRDEFGMLRGLNSNGMPQDRRLTAELTREDWINEALSLQRVLTPEVIEATLDKIPAELQEDYRDWFETRLHARLADLPQVASDYYDLLSNLVDVVGSDKHEQFTIRSRGDQVDVVMFKTLKDGEVRKELFRRTFHADETEEIRLYGLGGKDTFQITGDADIPIRIYAVGGTGMDTYTDATQGTPTNKHFIIHDTVPGSSVSAGPSTRDKRDDDPVSTVYDPDEFWFEVLLPRLFVESNQDVGLAFGGGFTHTSYRFRRKPYSTFHTAAANFAPETGGIHINYLGHFTNRLRDWGVLLRADMQSPNSTVNFFGFGNETDRFVPGSEFYRTRMTAAEVDILLDRPFSPHLTVRMGHGFELFDVQRDSDRFTGTGAANVDRSDFDRQIFGTVIGEAEADFRDNPVAPSYGFFWMARSQIRFGYNDASRTSADLSSRISWFSPLTGSPDHILGLQLGAGHTIGDVPFFLTQTVGGSGSLRGWRMNRFSGRTSFYQNVEIRSRLFRYVTPVAVGTGGILAFLDNGRVWIDDENSDRWHQSVGVGLWTNVFNLTVINIHVSRSEEETALSGGLGFAF
ncbi:MAG: hypothetical protein COV99_07510 [Bacteroidetes bacterium CG12_big_fil_rev_8_21_14_0_65_60_17]|nr:MAG: hypothetical protein COV99_07510 [Bacteroidetes bacterium CG12_big_fil_rev_8_21_14_0_65_60_17]